MTLTETEVKHAKLWLDEHRNHVMNLVDLASYCYPPSGSDKIRPELWKSAHWKWFFEEIMSIKPETSK